MRSKYYNISRIKWIEDIRSLGCRLKRMFEKLLETIMIGHLFGKREGSQKKPKHDDWRGIYPDSSWMFFDKLPKIDEEEGRRRIREAPTMISRDKDEAKNR